VLRTQVSRDGTLVAAIEAWLTSGKSVGALEKLLRDCDGEEALRRHFDEARLARPWRRGTRWRPKTRQLKRRLKEAKVNPSTIKSVVARLARASEIVAACQGDPCACWPPCRSSPASAACKMDSPTCWKTASGVLGREPG
jgi:hypothetical protein